MANDAPVLIDVTRLLWRRWEGQHPTGVDRVCLAYLDRYGHIAQAVVQHRSMRRILDRKASEALFQMLSHPQPHFRRKLILSGLRSKLARDLQGNDRIYFNLGHTSLNDRRFREWLRTTSVRPVYFVHDLIPVTHPEFCRPGEEAKHRDRMRTVLGTALGIIGNSKTTLEDLAEFAGSEHLPFPASMAAPLGSDAVPPRQIIPSARQAPTFVMLGTIESRKNHLLVLHVWRRLVSELGSSAPRLLIIGKRGWECEQVLDLLERCEAIKSAVVEISHCDDQELARHLRSARALLFPSFVEGYGLPLVEALRTGTPVIASDLQAFREIAGDVPDYLDPLDGPGWQRTIMSYASDDSAHRGAQLSRIESYSPPTWADHFRNVDAWLQTL